LTDPIPDFYVGETWTYRGQAMNADGSRVIMAGAHIKARFYTSQGTLLDLTDSDPEVIINTDDSVPWDYEIVVPPGSRQAGFIFPHNRYKLQVKLTTSDGQVSVDVTKKLRIEQSSFSRFL
jgi:hypothetical protein